MAEAAAVLHPADELAYCRAEIGQAALRQAVLSRREESLAAALVADREARVGTLHHAVVSRVDGRDCVDVERLPTLRELYDTLSGAPLVLLDTETTGLHPHDGDRLISAALLLPFWDLAQDDELRLNCTSGPFTLTVNPGRSSSPEAAAVRGLRDEHLADRDPFGPSHARAIVEACDGRVVVAHNAPFDTGFLSAEFERLDLAWEAVPAGVIDTRLISKLLWPGESGSLDALADRLGVDRNRYRSGAHTALGDVHLLAACLPRLRLAMVERL